MSATRILLLAAVAVPWLAACATGANVEYLEAQDARRIHSDASVGDLTLCLKSRLGEAANIVAYPEPGKVDVRIGSATRADTAYFYLVNLRQAQQGTDVEIRGSGEWRPTMSPSRVAGWVQDCKPGMAH
ncbi:hypothetical protein LMG31506_01645 [Cupriavidus yeoncheonensis]|uniref:Lipoprotein n=1 Tax=Cupriavidus yeoncheonensis TaxID=1462994 RepID=A0A916IQV7_9BURK|nr:hypothetical protein [Cupriavidus yeoncheonensis]CAG2136309.1 hypothetical protein LMG31506_01645 [Cupriavidus yeoncheonensis]